MFWKHSPSFELTFAYKLSRDVKSAILLDKIEKEIINFHAEQQRTLTDIREELRETNSNMGEILDILHGRRTADAAKSRAQSRPSMPAPINVFYGRSGVVDEVVEFLTKPGDTGMRPRACLCGPGGMGKTSTALAIMADSRLRASFPPRNQVWVPCVKATSVSLFLDTLYSSLAPVQNTGDPLEDVMSEIETAAEPLILLLDNFETLWNLTNSRSNVEDILNRLDKTNITLLMTTRSSAAPLSGDQWQSFALEAIDDDSARKIYNQIVPQSDKDPKVPDLLKALGCMPLAVTLMARRGKTTGLDAQKLLDEYNRRGTAMLGTAGNGMDARQSLDVCISLSVESQLILDTPRAYNLLVTLAMLPAGTDHQTLSDCWATPANFPNLVDALDALSQTSLLERRQTHYFVLPVIRSYVLDPSRFPVAVSDAVVASACRFLRGHTTFPGDPSFHEHAKALSAEESNLQAILLRMKSEAPRDDVIEAFLILADYQLMTRLKLEVIEHLVRLSCDGAVPQSLVGKVRTCYGKILMELGHLDKAEAEFNSAREIFLEAADNRRAARSTLFLVELRTRLHNVPSPERFGLIKDVRNAKALLKNFDDDNARDTALLNYYYGMIYGSTGYHDQGISYLTEAKKSFSALSDTLYGAKCSHWLQLLYYLERRYDVAQDQGNLAIKDFEQLGQYSGDAMQVLGRVLFAKENYKEALDTLTGALELCRSYGRTLDLAKTLEMIGRTWAKMGQIGDAREAYEKAQTYYGQVDSDKDYKLRCDFLSRQAADPSLLPTEEERSKLKVRYADY